MKLLPSVLLLLLLSACGPEPHHKTLVPGVYFWQYKRPFEDDGIEYFKENCLERFYKKVADIGWSEQYGAYPMAHEYYGSLWNNETGVIYITNDVFAYTPKEELPAFTEKMRLMINHYCEHPISHTINEVQIDCDWTEKTRSTYFEFLSLLKAALPQTKITVTLRLYQFKYRDKCGIPPCDGVTLMLYHTGKTAEISETNSIFSQKEAHEYLKHHNVYPLSMNIALPWFAWNKLEREGRFHHLINVSTLDVHEKLPFLEAEGHGFFRVTQDTVYHEENLRIGDRIQYEEAHPELAYHAVHEALALCKNDTVEILFFDAGSMMRDKVNNSIIAHMLDEMQ